jgi:hypothetical protein
MSPDRIAYNKMQPCRSFMKGVCTYSKENCIYSHDSSVCNPEYTKIKENMENSHAAPQQQQLVVARSSAEKATAPFVRIAGDYRTNAAAVQVVQRAQEPSKGGVSWSDNSDYSTRVAQLDLQYNRELSQLKQQANGGGSTHSQVDGESEGEYSGYSSAGDP